MNKRQCFTGLGLMIGSLLLCGFTLEAGLRIAQGRLLDTTPLNSEYEKARVEQLLPRAQYDDYLGWMPTLGQRISKGILYTVEDSGIRSNGTQVPLQKDGDTILVTGDSFTFGEEVSDDQTWPAQLERISRLRVVNGGVFNYGLDQIVLRSEQLAEKFRPDILVVSFIADDVNRCGQSIRVHPKPYFILDHEELVLKNVPVPPPLGQSVTPAKTDFFRRYLGYSYLADFVMRRINVHYWLNHKIALSGDKGFRAAHDQSVHEIGCALIQRLAEYTRNHPIQVVIMAQYQKPLTVYEQRTVQVILRCAEINGFKTLDLYDPLLRLKSNDSRTYDSLFAKHMTANGNAFVARQLYDFLLKSELIPRKNGDNSSVGSK